MKRSTKPVSVILETDIIEKLKQEAAQEKRTLSSMIRVILKSHLRQKSSESALSQIFKVKEGTCGSCTYYRPHYIQKGESFFPVSCGHCTRPRVKARKPDTIACEHLTVKENPPE